MPFPHHPEKHDSEALITPSDSIAYHGEGGDDFPSAVVLCYSPDLLAHLTETYDGERLWTDAVGLYSFAAMDGEVGVIGDFGFGAPVTAHMMEGLVARGTEAFLIAGIAGCLDHDVAMGDVLVPSKALRDEGTSHHYAPSERFAHPDGNLTDALVDHLGREGRTYHVGPTWTTDAIYRETKAEVERYAAEGVLTVEMEAAAAFTVAEHRGVDAGAAFVASDYLGPDEWDPQFDETDEALADLGETATEVLAEYVSA